VLAALGYYGGPTQTMIPLPGSPAICFITPSAATGNDQRGLPRVTPYSGTNCQDAGAVQTKLLDRFCAAALKRHCERIHVAGAHGRVA